MPRQMAMCHGADALAVKAPAMQTFQHSLLDHAGLADGHRTPTILTIWPINIIVSK